jgi:hypothetical protein
MVGAKGYPAHARASANANPNANPTSLRNNESMSNARGNMAQAPGYVEAQIAPYTSRTSLLLFGGLILIALNWVTSNGAAAFDAAVGLKNTGSITTGPAVSVLDAVLQAVGLGLLVLIASVSDDGGTFAILFLAALWVAWLYAHRDLFSHIASMLPSGPTTGQTGTTGATGVTGTTGTTGVTGVTGGL